MKIFSHKDIRTIKEVAKLVRLSEREASKKNTFSFFKRWYIWVALIFTILVLILYKAFFANPFGIDNNFYKDHLYIYETITNAYEEERPLTSFENSKIESIFDNVEKEQKKFSNEITSKSNSELDSQNKLNQLSHDVKIMFMVYDFANKDYLDEEEQREKLQDFLQQQKVAKAALGLKN